MRRLFGLPEVGREGDGGRAIGIEAAQIAQINVKENGCAGLDPANLLRIVLIQRYGGDKAFIRITHGQVGAAGARLRIEALGVIDMQKPVFGKMRIKTDGGVVDLSIRLSGPKLYPELYRTKGRKMGRPEGRQRIFLLRRESPVVEPATP